MKKQFVNDRYSQCNDDSLIRRCEFGSSSIRSNHDSQWDRNRPAETRYCDYQCVISTEKESVQEALDENTQEC